MSDLEKLRPFLIDLLKEAREYGKKATTNTVRASLDSKAMLLETIIVFITKSIQEGTLDMEKAKSQIKVLDEGTFEEVGRARRESPITSKIIQIAEELKPRSYKELDPSLIEPSHFTTRVYNLRAQGAIPQDVKPKNQIVVDGKVKKGLFLVRLTKEQMSAEPKRARRSKVEAE